MNGSANQPELSRDQLVRIAQTLKRIRDGLASSSGASEPAHIFIPGLQDAQVKQAPKPTQGSK
ncbi:hypothetical protein RFM26_03230 [Mesorhizobium sp. VK23B]|uniref:Uncharacterized protein n=1 Tax=Mesorhizobium dulcispinae TaxID=3072316 RepID=A0ABU4X926_9HYPH|nr:MULTISPECIES: hypothetical protein [unclassified Mesorhizobium]MDX8464693.1 hypothetical protein [Mesorhizobium sp. VK23B]MDX8471079.1 hypothetical protein [Mesorhizobium sp. VK23A]